MMIDRPIPLPALLNAAKQALQEDGDLVLVVEMKPGAVVVEGFYSYRQLVRWGLLEDNVVGNVVAGEDNGVAVREARQRTHSVPCSSSRAACLRWHWSSSRRPMGRGCRDRAGTSAA